MKANTPGIKIDRSSAMARHKGIGDEDEDEETYDEVMGELIDPWMAFPSVPGTEGY